MTPIEAIIAFVKLVPIFDRWAQFFVAEYVKRHYAEIRKDHREGIEATVKGDQRKLEEAIGHPNPGAPSGDAGSSIIDAPPPSLP